MGFHNENQMSKLSKGRSLADFLIMPVQRVPRYLLLLRNVLASTSNNHPDIKNLTIATGRISDAASHINESIGEYENEKKIIALQQCLEGEFPNLTEGSRKFIREGELTKVNRTGKQKEYMFFLFSDMVLYVESNPKGYTIHQHLVINNSFTVCDVHSKRVDKKNI